MSAGGDARRLDGADYGLLIDRKRPLSFSFDGRTHSGYEGDVIASALYAEGRTLLSRSFKYHRPRGVLTMAGQDANTMVQVGAQPNVRADQHALADGMAVTSINRLGSLDHDLYAAIGLFSRFLPVAFYYKTFYWPRGVWQHLFERPIRIMAGLGKLMPGAPHKYYDKAYLFADVLVIGGGPAGLEAAIAAAEGGADTLLIDDCPQLGGSLLYSRDGGDRASVVARRAELVRRAGTVPNLRIMTGTTVTGMFSDNWASAVRGNRFFKIRSKQTVIATGAFDQPLVFRNNDRPGIMFADAAQRLMRLYGVKPGTRAVIATSNRFGYEAALDLLDAGIAVAAVVDLNPTADSPSSEAVRARGVRIIPGSTLVDSKGRRHVSSVAVSRITGEGETARDREWIDCDLVLMSVGFSPSLNLASHAGAKVVFDPATNMHRATDLPAGIALVGAAAGVWSQAAVIGDSRHAGAAAAASALGRSGGNARLGRDRPVGHADQSPLSDLRRQGSRLHRLRRGLAVEGHRQHGQGRVRRHPVGEALFHRRARAEPGAPRQPQHHSHRRARNRQVDRIHRHDDLPPAAGAGEVRRPRRPRLRAGAPHGHASPPRRGRCADDDRRPVDAPRLLRCEERRRALDRA